MIATLKFKKNMEFECDNRGIKTTLDALSDEGGENLGPTPKELILNAMMGCTAIDVVSSLKKMRQEFSSFEMEVEAEKTTEYPTHFKSALLLFILKGGVEEDKLIRAVDLSLSKYCGVNYMISKICDISYKIILNDTEIKIGKTNFPD